MEKDIFFLFEFRISESNFVSSEKPEPYFFVESQKFRNRNSWHHPNPRWRESELQRVRQFLKS